MKATYTRKKSGRSTYEERCEKLLELGESLLAHRDQIIRAAVHDIQFTVKDVAAEVDISIDPLRMFAEAKSILEEREPLGEEGSFVSIMLSYNGSTCSTRPSLRSTWWGTA
jgi:acyl-CoA reductase-like NAD-dependent aldehyde dehydrogenase